MIRMVWVRSDEEERVSDPALIRLAIDFHHVEMARWLLQEQPLWVDLGRLFARETRAIDVLSRLPKGGAELPPLDGVIQVDRNQVVDGAVEDAVKRESTGWLAATLAGRDPDRSVTNCWGESRHSAADSGYHHGVQLLLHFGAHPNKEGQYGTKTLAKGAGYPRIVALLLEKGANPNAGQTGSWTNPLACAAKAKSIESLRPMLAYGGDATRVDRHGAAYCPRLWRTPTQSAVESCWCTVPTPAIKLGPVTRRRCTPLQDARSCMMDQYA
jgi:hypothetical protein